MSVTVAPSAKWILSRGFLGFAQFALDIHLVFNTVMEEKLNQLISKLQELQTAAGNSEDSLKSIGEALWEDVVRSNDTPEKQEKQVVEYANLINKAVEDFSDYADEFYYTMHFLTLGIERLSPKGAVRCATACRILFGTEDTCDSFEPKWANAALERCAELFTLSSIADVNDTGLVSRFKGAGSLVDEVAKAGEEYRELIANHSAFTTAVQASLALLDDGSSTDDSKRKPLLKPLRTAAALCDNSPEGKIDQLEKSVDLAKPDGNVLFEAYNAMCEEGPEDLICQQRAVNGPLTQLALQALRNQDEEHEGKNNLLLEALVFCRLLLQPWAKDDPTHMAAKLSIAESLRQQGVVEGLLKQLAFWEKEWSGSYGDCGGPCLMDLLELVRYFPTLLSEEVAQNLDAVALIRRAAATFRNNSNRFLQRSHETGESAAARLEALLDGKTEEDAVPPGTIGAQAGSGFGFGFGGAGKGLGAPGGFGLDAPPARRAANVAPGGVGLAAAPTIGTGALASAFHFATPATVPATARAAAAAPRDAPAGDAPATD